MKILCVAALIIVSVSVCGQDTLRATKKHGSEYVLIVAGFRKAEGCQKYKAIKIFNTGVWVKDTCYNNETGEFTEDIITILDSTPVYMRLYKKSFGEWKRIKKVMRCDPGEFFDWFSIQINKNSNENTINLCRLTGDYRASVRKTMEELEAIFPKE